MKYLSIFLLIGCTISVMGQKIKGKVVDGSSGAALSKANIKLGSDIVASTDSSGNFAFNTSKQEIVLTVTFTGYDTQQVVLKAPFQNFTLIRLQFTLNNLKEVTISTGYQTVSADQATGSFSQVDNQLYNRRVSSDVLSRLEGVVPGLLFNNNTFSAAGGAADISIRGTSSLFANTQPLIVVDGFPYDGDINNLNPNTVESITVLKDASAASIWGVKSGNGVIVITTKHGSRNKPMTVDFNANVTIGAKPNLYYSPDFLNSNDFINVEQTLFNQGFYDGTLSTPYAIVSPVVAILAKERSGALSTFDGNSQINALRKVDVRNDLTRYFYQRSVVQQYALGLSGGGINNDYYVSGGFDNNRNNLVGNGNRRVTLSSVFNFYPTKQLSFSVGINYAQSSTTANSPVANINGGANYSGGIYPYAQLVDEKGNALPIVKDYAAAYTDTAGHGKFYGWKYRPLDELHNADNTTQNLDDRINLSAKYTFLNGFSAELKYQYENQKGSTNNYFSDQTYYTRNLINEFTTIDQNGNVNYQIPQGGILQSSVSDLVAQRGRLQLNYNKDWNQKYDLAIIAGTELNQTITDGSAETVYGYDKNTLTDQNVDFADYFPRNPDGSYGQIPNTLSLGKFNDRYISYFSNAAYTYNNRYTFSISGRIDKSNLFGVNTNQKSVPLYSTGLSWNFSKEDFYHFDWLPYGKLRVTYGYNGNIDKNVTALTTFQQVSGAPYTGYPFSIIVSPGNPELRWERVRIINFGYEFATKNQWLSGTFEYYLKRGLDLFGDTPIAPSTGFSTFRGNTADIAGKGLDLNLTANIIRNGKFQWQSNFLLSYVLDKVTKYDAQTDVSSYLSLGSGNTGTIYPLTNQPLYAIYSYKWAGLTHNAGDPQGYLNGKLSTDYADILSTTTTSSMYYNGPSRPTTFGSFRNTFTYDRVALSFNIIYKLNYYFRRSSTSYTNLFAWIGNKDFDKRWQKPGDELTTNVPSIQYPPVDQNRDDFYRFSSILVDNGNNIRLQDINLSYDLIDPRDKIKHAFTHLQLYSYINNVGILWRANHDGLDPDLFTGSLPIPKTISFGMKATF